MLACRVFLLFDGGNWAQQQLAPQKRQPSSWYNWSMCLHIRGNMNKKHIQTHRYRSDVVLVKVVWRMYRFHKLKVVIFGWKPKQYSDHDPVRSFNFPWLSRSYFLFPFMVLAALQSGMKWNKYIKIMNQKYLLDMAFLNELSNTI